MSPNTLDAHRVIRWAGADSPEAQNKLVRGSSSFISSEGADIGDHAVLAAGGRAKQGWTARWSRACSPATPTAMRWRSEAATASRMGVTGVPCFLFEGKYAVMGAQDVSTLTDAIRQIAAAKARGELEKVG